MFKPSFLLFLYIKTIEPRSIKFAPGQPVPHADVLERVLANNIYTNSTEFTDALDVLFGNRTVDSNPDNLEISVLDPETIKKIVNRAKKKSEILEAEMYVDARRANDHEAVSNRAYFIIKAIDFMKQSIYATRGRLQRTRAIREKYKNNLVFNIGLMYGSVLQLKRKMENMLASIRHLSMSSKFLWFLVLYEKILAANVDMTDMIMRLFDKLKLWHAKQPKTLDIHFNFGQKPTSTIGYFG